MPVSRKRRNEDADAASSTTKKVALDEEAKKSEPPAVPTTSVASAASASSGAAVPTAAVLRAVGSVLPLSTRKGSVFICGEGDAGQLGLGEEITCRKKPTVLRSIEGEEIIQISAGGLHSAAVTASGKVYTWGCNDEGALGRAGEESEPAIVEGLLANLKIVQVTCGDSHTNVLSDAGIVYGWGTYRDSAGRMGFDLNTLFKEGLPEKHTIQFEPKVVLDLSASGDRVTKISASNNHTIALTALGHVYTWGCGEHGQLGRVGSRMSDRNRLFTVLAPGVVPFRRKRLPKGTPQPHPVNVFTGAYQSFVLFDNDTIIAFGLNNYYQCGLATTNEPVYAPTDVPALSAKSIVNIDGGEHHTLALQKDGTVLSFGRGDYGRLGHGNNDELSVPTPIAALAPNTDFKVEDIATGSTVSFAVTHDGKVYSWGMGNNYQLGIGPDDDMDTPTLVDASRFGDNKVIAASAGGQHTVFLVDYQNKIAPAQSAAASVSATPMSVA